MPSWLTLWKKEKRKESRCAKPYCENFAIPGRLLCEFHAFPGEQKKSNRRLAIEAQKAKVSEERK